MAFEMKYPHLFEPLRIRGTYFRNRIFAAPQGNYNVCTDRLPTAESIAFYERKAQGGFASVCVGDCVIDITTGANLPFLLDMQDKDNLPRMGMLTHAVTKHGAVCSAELAHDGMYSWASRERYGTKLYGPVECESRYGHIEMLTEEMIEDLIKKYAEAAAYAKKCGFTMVTVHAAHGWLPAQFMAPKMNTRKDKWGGSLENRMRFPIAILDAIRKAVGPAFPLEIRVSGSEVVEEGFQLEDAIGFCEMLDGHADILHISAGTHEVPRSWPVVHPSMFMPDGVNSKYAIEIKKHVSRSLVGTVGAFTDPAHMEELIASGQVDIINLARQSVCDPDFPNKARAGKDEEILRCLRCNKCFINSGVNRTIRCSINPETGQELDSRQIRPAEIKKKVLIAGGGIGGMEAAIRAAKRGHEVILCERSDKLGGALLCEEKVPFKKNLPKYIEHQIHAIKNSSVEVRLNTEVTPEYARKEEPDAIIAALGARPVVPKIPGIEKGVSAEEVYYDPELAKGKIIVLGAGLVGLELAIWLGQMGKDVDIVEMLDHAGIDMEEYPFLAYGFELKDHDISISYNTKALSLDETGLEIEKDGQKQHIDCDTLIYAVGQRSLAEEADALAFCAPEFYQIGDCVRSDSILAATKAAYAAANDI